MDRRRFLKYAGTSAAVVGASALGLDYVLSPRPGPANQSTATLKPMRSTSKQNHPPVAGFDYKPKYLNPTDQQTIQFTGNCYDADNDPLQYAWSVDGEQKSAEKDYSTRLPGGDHAVRLSVSDGLAEDHIQQAFTVEPDQIYPTRPLHLRYKGVSYFAGPMTPEWGSAPNPTMEEMDEQLDTLYQNLGCNAIIICGGKDDEEKIVECARLAIGKGFERIYVQPRYVNATVDETIDNIRQFAPRVRELRETSGALVFSIGHEFTLETAITGKTFWERYQAAVKEGYGWSQIRTTLPAMFAKLVQVCKQHYGYSITYASIPVWEHDLVPWENPIFESVGVDVNICPSIGWTEDWNVDFLSHVKSFRKPVISTDWGVFSYKGADQWGGISPIYLDDNPYDEDSQARYVDNYCRMLNRARIDGCFWVQYNEQGFDKGHALYNPLTRSRKKGFYMYKSYQRTS